MQGLLAFVATMILGSTCAWVAGCSSNNTPSPGSSVDSGATDSSAGCSGAGTSMAAKFDFAATAPALNGGKGQVLSIHVCDTVTWTNDDNAVPHSVVSTGGGFTFQTPMVTGTTAGVLLGSVQFPTAGTFTYQCGVHGSMMIGQVTVQ